MSNHFNPPWRGMETERDGETFFFENGAMERSGLRLIALGLGFWKS